MINGYKVINQNEHDVLFLYLDSEYNYANMFSNIKLFLIKINPFEIEWNLSFCYYLEMGKNLT